MSRHPLIARAALLAALLVVALFAPIAPAREVVTAPANGGPGETIRPPDNAPLAGPRPARAPAGPPETAAGARTAAAKALDTIGGDDVFIAESPDFADCTMGVASDGDIYIAVDCWRGGSDGAHIEVYRSVDNGNTFSLWGTLGGGYLDFYRDSHLRVVEGVTSVCMVVFSGQDRGGEAEVRLASSPLGGATASFTTVTVMSQPDINFFEPRFDTDVQSYDSFFVYVVAYGSELGLPTGSDIWFARSTNQGASFEAPYMLATLAVPDRYYRDADIAYGYGGHLHVCWYFWSTEFDSSVRYRRASSFAGGGIASWDNWVTMTSTSDGYDDRHPRIAAGHASNDVVLCYERLDASGSTVLWEDLTLRASQDAGVTWTGTGSLDDMYPCTPTALVEDHDSGIWYLLAHGCFNRYLWTTTAADLTTWSNLKEFADEDYPYSLNERPGLALNPAKDNRPAMAWVTYAVDPTPRRLYFDGAWRSDPGYPNLEPGFPLGLWAPPVSPPALVDVDGDGDLEIVFADGLRMIQVIDHDGGSPPGWPVDAGVALSDGPVAVGDLDGDGEPTIVVGTAAGRVLAYDAAGAPLPGWPITLSGTTSPVYVSIGALGGPYPRTIVACSGNRLYFRSQHGSTPPGVPGWLFNDAYAFTAPVAIGDVDDDGVAEAVGGLGPLIFSIEMHGGMEFNTNVGNVLSDAVTLGDLDLDGDLEILCPTQDGILHVRDHTGAAVAGFPFSTGTSYDLTSAAIAQCYGTVQPDIAFGRQDWTAHLLQYTGAQATGYPVHTGTGWWLWGAPIIGRVDGTSADVVVGARDKDGWAWSNLGVLCEGWPKDAGGYVQVSPAMGDIDLDGSAEIVFVADTQLLVLDVNNTVTDPSRTWPMYGHDPQRTGCSDCPEDLVTAIDPGDPAGTITRVRFAPPSPNPISGPATFAFEVPLRAVVSLDVFDLRGRRVHTVLREEAGPGARTVTWHGRDADGQPLASGEYVARLRVRGPGVDEVLTRKMMIVR